MDKQAYMNYFFGIISCCFLFSPLTAQDENLAYEDRTYVDFIRTVQLYPAGVFLGYPIIELNSGNRLVLTFDDLADDVVNYTYSIVHCNADWKPSDLIEMEYIDGYSENNIDNFEFSFNTMVPYTQYTLEFPNRELRFTKSGNYLLKIYEDEDKKRLVITRRFMVVEPVMRIFADIVRPSIVSKSDTHQELDFVVSHKGIDVRSPLQEIQATVMQNGRWGTAIRQLRPLFQRQDELIFDYQDKIVFEAGKEFRAVDLRSFRSPGQGVFNIERFPDGTDVTLYKDAKRVNQAYLEFDDINGRFAIETFDDRDNRLETDYANVLFALTSSTEYYEESVYLIGGFSEWKIKPEYRMTYNERVNAYVAELFLKQGYYDYYYALVPNEGGPPDISLTEGNWFETENEYTVLVYYRPFGGRYDRLVATATFSSRI